MSYLPYNSLKRSFSGLSEPHKKPRTDFLTSMDIIEPVTNNLVVTGELTPFHASSSSFPSPDGYKVPRKVPPAPRSKSLNAGTSLSTITSPRPIIMASTPKKSTSTTRSSDTTSSSSSYNTSKTLTLASSMTQQSLHSFVAFSKKVFRRSSLPDMTGTKSSFYSKWKHLSKDMSHLTKKFSQLIKHRKATKTGKTAATETDIVPLLDPIDLNAIPPELKDQIVHIEENEGNSVAGALLYFLYQETGTVNIPDLESLVSKLNDFD